MENIWIVWAITSLVSLLYGLNLIFGLGWAMFIIDLLTQNVTSDYANDQRRHPPTKDGRLQQRGVLFVIFGIITAVIAIKSL